MKEPRSRYENLAKKELALADKERHCGDFEGWSESITNYHISRAHVYAVLAMARAVEEDI